MYRYEKRKLSFQMVPSTSWFHNLRSLLSNWPEISKSVRSTGCCHCCGRQTDTLDAHEVWAYDDENHVQTLNLIIPVCKSCHNTIHIGFATASGRAEQAIRQYIKVNGLTRAEAEEDLNEAARVWERRSRYRWTMDETQLKNKVYELTGIYCRFRQTA